MGASSGQSWGCGYFRLWADWGHEPAPSPQHCAKFNNGCSLTGWCYWLGPLLTLTLLHMGGWQCVHWTLGQDLFSSESPSAQVQTGQRQAFRAAAGGGPQGCELWLSPPGLTWFIAPAARRGPLCSFRLHYLELSASSGHCPIFSS